MSEHQIQASAGTATSDVAPDLYLDLLKRVLTRCFLKETWHPIFTGGGFTRHWFLRPVGRMLRRHRLEVVRPVSTDPSGLRARGGDYPIDAETMVGLKRLDNLQFCIGDVLDRGVPGDLIETGVWRGGSAIFMRAVLKARGDTSRLVWVADSFQGLPKPDASHADDTEDRLWSNVRLSIPLEEVRENFARYELLDSQVRFLPGWFSDTLPDAPIEQLAVLRLDGDMYESTMTALCALYPKLSVGGYVIVDDYYTVRGCRRAIEEFRQRNDINDEMYDVDGSCVFWRRSG